MKSQKTHMKILETIALNPKITIPSLAKQLDRSESAIRISIQKLQKESYLRRIGPAEDGYWDILDK